jgi:transcriptional regulator with XRE-family HTH domain
MTAQEFREARKRRGLTQEEFGELIGSHRTTIARRELGTRVITRAVELQVKNLPKPKKQPTEKKP